MSVRFIAVLRQDNTVLVVGTAGRRSGAPPIEALTAQQFLERTEACGIVWREGAGETLTTVVDHPYGTTLMETRFQLR